MKQKGSSIPAAAHVAAGARTHAHEDLTVEAHPDQGGLLIEYHLPSLVTHLGGGVRPSHRCLRRVAVSPGNVSDLRWFSSEDFAVASWSPSGVRLVLSSCPRPLCSPYAVRCPRGPWEWYYHDYIHRTFSIHHSAPSTGHDTESTYLPIPCVTDV